MTVRKCIICKQLIELNDQCLRINIGEFAKHEDGCIEFNRIKSTFGTIGYSHFNCLDKFSESGK